MKYLMMMFVLATVTACEPVLLDRAAMLPSDVAYDRVSKNAFLRNKITVGEFLSQADEQLNLANFSGTLSDALRRAGLRSADNAKATYEITGTILEVGNPQCFFGVCDNGSAIRYELTHIKQQRVVWTETIVVPHSMNYPLFGADIDQVILSSFTGAIGENISHTIQLLGQKTAKDLQ